MDTNANRPRQLFDRALGLAAGAEAGKGQLVFFCKSSTLTPLSQSWRATS